MKFKERVAIVTGGGAGIGMGCAKVLAREGAKVVVVDWDAKTGENTAADIRAAKANARFVQCDVSNEEQVKAVVQTTVDSFGRLDILVNNAGVGVYKSILESTSADWDRCLAINVKGIFLFSKFSIPHMQAAGKGVIINMSSVHAHATAKGVAPYAASKGAVTALTRNMALDYAPTIRVNAIAPGWVWTPLIESIFQSYPDPAAMLKTVTDRQVMRRMGTPEDIGNAVAFLASDEASFITGAELRVDGGLTCLLEDW
jgi:NAD(P)-dependent dehydrogenase (short-subunit alcohol dehydrogenase family)